MRCQRHELDISNALSGGGEIPERTARHLADCPRCRAFLQRSRRTEADLGAALSHRSPEPPRELHARILRGVHAACRARERERGAVPQRIPRVAWASAAAILLLAGTLAVVHLRSIHTEIVPAPAAVHVLELPPPVPPGNPVALADSLDKSVTDQYRREIEALRRDLDSAAEFLARCVGG